MNAPDLLYDMKVKSAKKTDFSHHAYYAAGGRNLIGVITDLLAKADIIHAEGNPDFYKKEYASFTIDDARELKSVHETKPVKENGMKVFVLYFGNITIEAQNALLKLLEEPAEYAKFYIIIPSAHLLLPTVKSRLAPLDPGDDASPKEGARNESARKTELPDPDKFISAEPAKRLETVKKLLDDISNERRPRQDAIEFLHSLESVLRGRDGDKNLKSRLGSLQSLQLAVKYSYDKSSSLKMLLEYVSVNL